MLAIGRLQVSCFERKDGSQGTGFDVWADDVQNVSRRSAAAEGDDGRALLGAAVGELADEPLDDSLPF